MLEPDPPNTARPSPYRGVSWHRGNRRWRAKIRTHDIHVWLGYFDDPETAARVYDVAAKKLFGDESFYNFPDLNGEPPPGVPLGRIYIRLKEAGVI